MLVENEWDNFENIEWDDDSDNFVAIQPNVLPRTSSFVMEPIVATRKL